jgi:uncharacterized protein (DUF1499 family)
LPPLEGDATSLIICASDESLMNPADLTDPTQVRRTGWPNDALIGPPDVCKSAPDVATPNFAVPRDVLEQGWLDMLHQAPRTERLAHDPARHLYLFRRRSAVFGFPDLISVRFLSAEGDHATLAAYSRATTGYYDFGVNRRRLQRWLKHLTGRVVATEQVPRTEGSAKVQGPRSADVP